MIIYVQQVCIYLHGIYWYYVCLYLFIILICQCIFLITLIVYLIDIYIYIYIYIINFIKYIHYHICCGKISIINKCKIPICTI